MAKNNLVSSDNLRPLGNVVPMRAEASKTEETIVETSPDRSGKSQLKPWLKVGACFVAYYAFAKGVLLCEAKHVVSHSGAFAFLLAATVALLFLAVILIFTKPPFTNK